MAFEMQEARPPYFTFETRRVEKRTPVAEGGMLYADFCDYVIITPQGSKDRVEKLVEDWFLSLEDRVKMGMFRQDWLTAARTAYAAWKDKKEIPLSGTPIRGWVLATEAEQEKIITLNLKTVEDLAAANAEAVARLGMGGQMLKNRAMDFLQAQKDTGPIVARVEAQNQLLETLQETVRKQADQIRAFEQMLQMSQRLQPQQVAMPSRPTFDNGPEPDDIGNAIDIEAQTLASQEE